MMGVETSGHFTARPTTRVRCTAPRRPRTVPPRRPWRPAARAKTSGQSNARRDPTCADSQCPRPPWETRSGRAREADADSPWRRVRNALGLVTKGATTRIRCTAPRRPRTVPLRRPWRPVARATTRRGCDRKRSLAFGRRRRCSSRGRSLWTSSCRLVWLGGGAPWCAVFGTRHTQARKCKRRVSPAHGPSATHGAFRTAPARGVCAGARRRCR